jgi:hypothetical protein
MTNFKAGHWVRSKAFGIGKIDSLHKGCTTTVRVKGWYTRDTRDNTRNYDINIQHCEHWKPEVGEFVCVKFIDSAFTVEKYLHQPLSRCEPFLGELPSFLKDS